MTVASTAELLPAALRSCGLGLVVAGAASTAVLPVVILRRGLADESGGGPDVNIDLSGGYLVAVGLILHNLA
jgi:hypothetical protein